MKYVNNDELNNYLIELLNNGFRVCVFKYNKHDYATFSKNDKIGYVEIDYFGGFNFSTKHKPNKTEGTGYRIHTQITNPTIQHSLDCFGSPDWTPAHQAIKYKSFDEFLSKPINFIYKEITLT